MARHGVLSEFDNAKEEWQSYIAELRKLSNDCDYGESLNEMLRDHLVCGVKNKRIQRRLLAEPAQWKLLKRLQRTSKTVHYQKKEQEGSTKPCKHCGKTNHQEELHGKKKNPE